MDVIRSKMGKLISNRYEPEKILATVQRCCKRFPCCAQRSRVFLLINCIVCRGLAERERPVRQLCGCKSQLIALFASRDLSFFVASAANDDKWRISKTGSNYGDTMLIAAIQSERLCFWMNPQLRMGRISFLQLHLRI